MANNNDNFVFVKGFAKDTTEQELTAWFQEFGTVLKVYLPKKSGYGFVYFTTVAAVVAAVARHNTKIGNQVLIVRWGIPGAGGH